MTHLKLFESEDSFWQKFKSEIGISEEEIKDYFYDIVDDGWSINVRFTSKLFDFKTYHHGEVTMGRIPYIKIEIWKHLDATLSSTNLVLRELESSDKFKRCLEGLENRIEESGMFIPKPLVGLLKVKSNGITIDGNRLVIFIYRRQDEKYIK